ncbi:NAD-dependent succinate-semialdehyde dehydrogenase [Pseudomonas sp. 5P_3.1_Bac2]|uniref:NAD-dependent succinate-semialdehyde dehydrogenase n=1 Tax=Pseudomonas sp. 5P_3.1_Bac2 TaxID=2971617 RepID=UPI0021C5D7D1|nr:NAD-dependent succinate-semialdehyde dehydrogenase [Pseudomonas sp. 5P_3.1_Bac2]MCU1716849.1 NAD-dependent succinate-semialdehyde dehydrogenase [Pseudomonas sp. 5P_3.1_Bac2]
MYPPLALYIAGEFIHTNRPSQAVFNPADGSQIGQLPHALPSDLELALSSAEQAFASWRTSAPTERSAVLRRAAALARERAEQIAHNLTLDQGKPLAEALREVHSSAEHLEWHGEEARRIYGRIIPARQAHVRQSVTLEPVGVCAAFTPWNYPLSQAVKKVAAAIGAGCSIILKGPEQSPSAVVALAQLLHDAGLPAGVLNIVWGEPAQVSEQLIRSPIVRKVSFTGSVPVGKQLAALAGQYMKRTTFELGGHSPVLVFNDADVEQAAQHLAHFKVLNAGQVCISPTRFFIQEQVYERFLEHFTKTLASIKVGNGLEPGTQMGPLVSERRLHTSLRLIEDARSKGAQIALGGEQLGSAGHFLAPTVLTEVPADAAILHDEPFAPIAPVLRFSDPQEAIRSANSLPYGLAAYVFTNSLRQANQASAALEAGMIGINHFGIALPETPFGGIKDSGIGSEGGSETFDGYLVRKYVSQL